MAVFFQEAYKNLIESPNGSALWWHSLPLPDGNRISSVFEYASDVYPTIAIQNKGGLALVGISNFLFPNEHAMRNLAYSYNFEYKCLNGPHNVYSKENASR